MLPRVAVPVSMAFVKALVGSREFGKRARKFDLWVGQLAGLGRSRPWVAALDDLRQAGSVERAGPIFAAGVEEVKHSAGFVQECHSVDAAVKDREDLLAENLSSGALLATNSGFLVARQEHRRNTKFAI